MQKITPFLWYDGKLDEAIAFYTSIFKNSKLISKRPGPDGTTFTAIIELEGQEFMMLNGGPMFKFTEAVSLFVSCETQEEIDYYWSKLLEGGGQEYRCGWLKDKYGLSWQIIPTALERALTNSDPVKANKSMQAMLKMGKLIIKDLEA